MERRYQIPHPSVEPRGPDWSRVSRWSFIGATIMFFWLLSPTAQCSWYKFRDTVIVSDLSDSELDVWRADKERLDQTESFFERWLTAVELCYARTPLMGQSPWKSNLLLLLLAIGIGSRIAGARWQRSRRPTMY